jgi:hypothetical protein
MLNRTALTPHEALIIPPTVDLIPRLSRSLQPADQRSVSKARHSETGVSSTPRADEPDEPPRKMRRVSSPGPVDRRNSMGVPGASAATPLYVGSGSTPQRRRHRDRDLSASTGKRFTGTVNGKGKEFTVKGETTTPVPTANARANSSKRLADYSAYKGRGRYAHDGARYVVLLHL